MPTDAELRARYERRLAFQREWSRKYRLAHPDLREKSNQYMAAWRDRNPEQVRLRAEKYRKENSQKVKESQIRFLKNHPERRKEIAAKYRANHPEVKEKERLRAIIRRQAKDFLAFRDKLGH